MPRSEQVHGEEVRHLLDRLGRERRAHHDTGVVHQQVDPAKRIDGHPSDRLTSFWRGDTVGDGDGVAAEVGDLLDHTVGHGRVGFVAPRLDADVVDHDGGAAPGEMECIGAAEAATGPGHHCDLSIKVHRWHRTQIPYTLDQLRSFQAEYRIS